VIGALIAKGWVHADGYAGFNGVFGDGKAGEQTCMAHIRRKFVDVHASQGSAVAEQANRTHRFGTNTKSNASFLVICPKK
jgi:Transposase IS66 family